MKQTTIRLATACLAFGLFAGGVSAATFTWNGDSATSDDWSDGDNWVGDVAPDNDGTADIHFAGSARTTPNVDTAWSINSITFDSGAAAFAIGGSTVTLATSSGNAMTNSSSNTQSLAVDVDFNTGGQRAISTGSGDINLTGQWTLIGSSTAWIRGGQQVTFGGLVTGSGSLNRTDPGTTILNDNTNDFAGNLSIAHGVVVAGSIADAGVASAIGAGSTIQLGQGTYGPSDTGTLRYTGATASTDRTVMMSSNGATLASEPSQSLGFSGRPTIEVTEAATTLTFNGDFNYAGSSTLGQWRLRGAGDGVINGDITTTGARLEKAGAGTWTLNGTNSYTGLTEVKAGMLLVNGSLASSDVEVFSGATLGGMGMLAGNVDVASGGFLAAGTSIGTLQVSGNVTLAGTMSVEIDAASTGSSDLLDVDSDLDITAATVDFNTTGTLDDTAYVFATYNSLTGSQFDAVSNLPSGYYIDTNYLGGNQIALVAVPEPSSVTTLSGLALLVTSLLRERR